MKAKAIAFDKYLAKAIDYNSYLALIRDLVSDGKTTGPNQSEDLVAYTKLNLQRMERLNKTIQLKPEMFNALKNIKEPQTWLVITEAWCGDAAQNIPLLAKLAETHPYIKLRLILRDENLELMDQFLTNGGRAIPILLMLNAKQQVLYKWGPRPQKAQDMVEEYKKQPEQDFDTFKATLHGWYAKNKTEDQQNEFVQLIK
jgi:hypothetical protein